MLGLVTGQPREGVTFGEFADGSARRVAIAGGVEHVGVLYSRESMREAVAWLDRLYARTGSGYADSRGLAIIALILGLGLLAWPLSRLLPVVSRPPRGASLPWRQLLPVATIPALGTPLLLWWFPADFLGVLVGGYLAIHFLVYGLFSRWIYRATGHSAVGALANAVAYAWALAAVFPMLSGG